MGDKLTITIPAGNTLPIAYNNCTCDCHRLSAVEHNEPCCSPMLTYEDTARMLQPDELPKFVEKHHDTVRQLGIVAADRMSDENIEAIAARLKEFRDWSNDESMTIDIGESIEALCNDIDSLIKHAKSLQFELDVQVNFK